jgi:menaquinone-9 beta-reductase
MKKICVVGCGPAGAVVAALLKRIGYDVLVVSNARIHPIWEGMSMRAADGLRSAGFECALDAASKLARRFSSWHGHVERANGEYLIERQSLDRALWDDLSRLGISAIRGAARHYEQHETGWRVTLTEESGTQRVIQVDYLIAASGRSGGENIGALSGPVSVMMSQSFSARLGSEPFTFIEPFEDGWAWATWNGIDHASLHVTLASTLVSNIGGKLAFTASCKKLEKIQKIFGAKSFADGPVSARGSRPFIKKSIADSLHLKVGDAAYTVDPLSGHGMYEAISGAYAAAPVIHTILERPENAEQALRFYRNRAASLFYQRMKSGIELYKSEMRWTSNPFWTERSRDISERLEVLLDAPSKPHFMKKPVVENGWIVEREVLFSKGHPQGIRFINGIDLAQLYRLINTSQKPGMEQLSVALKAQAKHVVSAMHTLVQEGMATHVWGSSIR